jgi:hypothetical protein
VATGAHFGLSLVFPHEHLRGWDIDDLTTLDREDGLLAQIALTMLAGQRGMNKDLIGRFAHHQVLSPMAALPSRGFFAFGTQALWLTGKTIRGRGQMAIMAIFGQALFQFLHALLQVLDGLQCLLQRGFQLLYLLIFVHTCTVPEFHLKSNSLAYLSSYNIFF